MSCRVPASSSTCRRVRRIFFATSGCGDRRVPPPSLASHHSRTARAISTASSPSAVEVDQYGSEPQWTNRRPLGATGSHREHSNQKETRDLRCEGDDCDDASASALVDAMVRSTLRMVQSSQKSLHVVAFSGGVDSSLAAALVQRAVVALATMPAATTAEAGTRNSNGARADALHRYLPSEGGALLVEDKDVDLGGPEGDRWHRVRAVMGLSPAVSREQLEQAERVAAELHVDFRTVPTGEGRDPTYLANAGQACRACKTHLYSTLESIHRAVAAAGGDRGAADNGGPENGAARDPRSRVQLYNGTNADDLLDPTRVGLRAAEDFGVASPLRHYTKRQVRAAARHLGLSNWDAAASPCLRSRLALGVPATALHLGRVEDAERAVRGRLAALLTAGSNVRVRMLAGGRARIEVDATVLDEARRVDWDRDLVQLGFAPGATVGPFRSGSVAATV